MQSRRTHSHVIHKYTGKIINKSSNLLLICRARGEGGNLGFSINLTFNYETNKDKNLENEEVIPSAPKNVSTAPIYYIQVLCLLIRLFDLFSVGALVFAVHHKENKQFRELDPTTKTRSLHFISSD